MLTPEQNDLLAKVGPGTPMGRLMRRYWHPVAAVAELDENPVKPVRLMGEDLVLFKDASGEYGLLERHCPHRRADLSYGWVEEDGGLRCSYHGWLFDTTGRCIGQPYEQIAHPEANFKEKVRATAHHVQAKARAAVGVHRRGARAGAVGLGPLLRPGLQAGGVLGGAVQLAAVPGELDRPGALRVAALEPVAAPQGRPQLLADAHAHRVRRVRVRHPVPGASGRTRTRRTSCGRWGGCACGRTRCTPGTSSGGCRWTTSHTLSVGWFIDPIPGEQPFEQERIPYWRSPIVDAQTGRWISSHIMNQDFIAWVGQGSVSDRWNEHLGESDRGSSCCGSSSWTTWR